MSVTFRSIAKLVGDRELIIMPNPDKTLVGFGYMDPPTELSSSNFYAMKASTLKKIKHLENMNFLVLENSPVPQEWFGAPGLNLIIVKDVEVYNELRIRIQKLFDEQAYINNCAYSLMELVRSNIGIHELLEAAHVYLTNPMFLFDTSHVLVDSAGFNRSIKDAVVVDIMDNGTLPQSFIRREAGAYAERRDEDLPEYLSFETITSGGQSSIAISSPVVRGDVVYGSLKLFEYNHPMSFVEKNIFIIVSQFVSLFTFNGAMSANMTNIQMDDFLNDLLNQKITTEEAIESRAKMLNIGETQDMHALVIKRSIFFTDDMTLHFLKKRLCALFEVSTVTIYNPYLVLVVPAVTFESMKSTFEDFLQDNDLVCGVSLKFRSFMDFYRQYTQALACLDMRAKFSVKDSIVYYDDYKLLHLFMNFEPCCNLKDLVPRPIMILREYDSAHGTSLLETLFNYVHCHLSISETAAKMYLHYNTLKYRIAQITDLTAIDFENYDEIFAIEMGEKVLYVLEKQNTGN